MSVVAVIPAKGTSRRVPGKNLLDLAGHPLFGHSVRVAMQASLIDTVVVSSESDIILEKSEAYGAQAVRRSPELCADNATNFQVLCDLHSHLTVDGVNPSLFVLLQPTTPFRSPGSLDELIRSMLDTFVADSLVTVLPAHRMRGRVDNGFWVRSSEEADTRRAQSTPGSCEITGHVFILRPDRTLNTGRLLGEHVLAANLPEDWLDVDVDTPREWRLAQTIAPYYFQAEVL